MLVLPEVSAEVARQKLARNISLTPSHEQWEELHRQCTATSCTMRHHEPVVHVTARVSCRMGQTCH